MKIAAVLVTYNRLEKLKKTIQAYTNLIEPVDYLVVVNNHSDDGTAEFLAEWGKTNTPFVKDIIHLSDNMGCSGGVYEASKRALTHDVDWVLVADDDAYPDKNIISEFKKFVTCNDIRNISAICSTVKRIDQTIDVGHRKWYKSLLGIRPLFIPSEVSDYKKDSFDIDLFSYVGVFLKVDVLNKIGLCNPGLFIYYDDIEHSMRVNKTGRVVCVPKILFDHDDGAGQAKADTSVILSWRDYYAIRNKIYTLLKYKPITGVFWTISRLFMCYVKHIGSLKAQKLYITAIIDGVKGNLGKHPKYRPGFAIKK